MMLTFAATLLRSAPRCQASCALWMWLTTNWCTRAISSSNCRTMTIRHRSIKPTRQLQDARIAKAVAGIDQAKAQIAAAEAGKEAVQAELIRARSERKRQEGLYQTHSTTEQNLETAVAAEGNLSGQFASREADLNQAQTMLRSSELAAEAERRSKAVLESQGMELQADLRAKQA